MEKEKRFERDMFITPFGVEAYPFGNLKCPSCNKKIRMQLSNEIDVRIESKGTVRTENSFWRVLESCKNPMCEWSKLNQNDS